MINFATYSIVINFYHTALNNPERPRQLSCGESLIAEYSCTLKNKLQDGWSHYNYLIYVLEGRKT
ncbi:MAG TPA: hypothetical protein VGG71_10600, partial [Chitinophagaceae bacterium]